jgi:hypothetical protein
MRRPTLLLAAGLLAYFIGATVRVYLGPGGPCSCRETGCRIRAVAESPLAALRRPLTSVKYLAAPSCSD